MNRLNLINAIGELIIPLMGFLFLDWGIYFILLFYFIDLVVTEVFVYVKVNKIIQFQKINFPFRWHYGRLMLNTFLMLIAIVSAHIAVCFIVPDIDFILQIHNFLSYEEVGVPIPQGYILLPLVVFANFQQYKMTFIKTQKFQISSWKNLIFARRRVLYVIIIGGVIATVLAYFISLPSAVYIFTIIVIKFYFDFHQQ